MAYLDDFLPKNNDVRCGCGFEIRLELACRTADFHDFVFAQPEGCETQVSEADLALSGGQAHRFAVPGALLKDARIPVLDGPTESLDSPTATALMRTFPGCWPTVASFGSRSARRFGGNGRGTRPGSGPDH